MVKIKIIEGRSGTFQGIIDAWIEEYNPEILSTSISHSIGYNGGRWSIISIVYNDLK